MEKQTKLKAIIDLIKTSENVTLGSIVEKIKEISSTHSQIKDDMKLLAKVIKQVRSESPYTKDVDNKFKLLEEDVREITAILEKNNEEKLSNAEKKLLKSLDISIADLRNDIDEKISEKLDSKDLKKEVLKLKIPLDIIEGFDEVVESLKVEQKDYSKDFEQVYNTISIVDNKIFKNPIGLEVFHNGQNFGRFPSLNFQGGTVNASASRIDIDLSSGSGGSSVWGGITGTLSNQTDLQNALDLKVDYTATADLNMSSHDIDFTTGDIVFNRGGADELAITGQTLGVLRLTPATTFGADLNFNSLTTAQTFTFPDATGTIALTSDIPSSLALQTNGTPNGSQATLNLVAGTNITLTDNGTGSVTIDASGGGAGMAIGGSITSATEGSVLFAGASGVLAQDNANFFWDNTNNRLGLGTTSPTEALDVNGNIHLYESGLVKWSGLTDTSIAGLNWFRSGSFGSRLRIDGSNGDLVYYNTTSGTESESFRVTIGGSVRVGGSFTTNGMDLGLFTYSGLSYITGRYYNGTTDDSITFRTYLTDGSGYGDRLSISQGLNSGANIAKVKVTNANLLVTDGKAVIGGTSTSALLTLGTAGTTAGTLSLAGSTSGVVTIQTAAAAGTYTLTLPTNDGDSGQVLTTDGSGVTSWTTLSSREVTVSISSAEILALHTTPKTLIAAQGAGTLILIDQILWSFTGGTAYANGDNLRVQYNGDTQALAPILSNTVLNTTSSSTNLRGQGTATGATNVVTTPGTNKAVEVGLASATAFITGTGTLKAFIRYRVITL